MEVSFSIGALRLPPNAPYNTKTFSFTDRLGCRSWNSRILSQQLQLSIDRLKFGIELDQERIDYWKAFIEEVSKEEGGQIPWVTARNNDASIYLTKAMPVDANSNNTISLMIQNVNDIWQ